ncbi:MAG: DEAD/DEAH box helicase [Firmicutes bacterium]|nr:DEAD/DEAH box helicase [Bacillota bacterium]
MGNNDITLRPYQESALVAADQALREGITKQIWSMATGLGKTFSGTFYAMRRNQPTLWLVHRDELIRQAANAFATAWPGANIGIVKAEEDAWQAPIVVASVQSLSEKRLHRWHPEQFGTVIVDESHHAAASSYQKILRYLQPELLLGLTATPYRTDKATLEGTFDKIVFSYGIQEGIKDGYLVDIRAFRIRGQADLDAVHTQAGDFNAEELATALNTVPRNRLIVEAYQHHAAHTKAMAFTAGVQHAYDLAQAFQATGIPAAAVDGKMPMDERRAILTQFKAGTIQVLTNAMLYTEGFDEPSIETIILARPTKSLGLFTQMVGRGTRPADGKSHMILLDIADNTKRHKLITVKDLIGMRKDPENGTSVAARMAQESRISDAGERWLGHLNLHSDAIDLFADLTENVAPTFDWRDVLEDLAEIHEDPDALLFALSKAHHYMQDPEERATDLQRQRLQDFGWDADAVAILTKWEASYALDRHKQILADWSAQRAATMARMMGWDPRATQLAVTDALWKLTPSTPKQRALLKRLKVPEELIFTVTKGEAAKLIDTELATKPQKAHAH